ncbi:hypothetical protein, partial [Vibrio sp. V43_P6S15P86]|uniref:hypothetical protein n=1 Tax=Vibrio sp. V43_P6S15P86 TaxID=1938694 RepID=UPI001F332B95
LLIHRRLEELRTYVARFLDVDSYCYHDAKYRYVELFSPNHKPLHISNYDIIARVDNSLVVNFIMVIAVEFDGGIEPYSCLLQARYNKGSVEFNVSERESHWTLELDKVTVQIFKKIKQSLSFNPLRLR